MPDKIKVLWELAGEIGVLGEKDPRYARVYHYLSLALDAAEDLGLIKADEIE